MIKEKIEEKLKTEISSRFVEVINESPNHNVPDGAESHFKVTVVSDEFENLRPVQSCLLYTSPSPRDMRRSRMPSSA